MISAAVWYNYVGGAVHIRRPHLVSHARLREQMVHMILEGSSRSGFAAVHDAGGGVQEVVNVPEDADNFSLTDLSFGEPEKLVFGLVAFS